METNEIMTNEVVEETVEVNESKSFNPATGIIAGLAIVGTYYVVTKAVDFTKDTISKIKAKRAASVDNDFEEDDIFDEE